MENNVGLELGSIVCKHCQTLIGTFASEKVTVYYSDCQEQDCWETRLKKNKEVESKSSGGDYAAESTEFMNIRKMMN